MLSERAVKFLEARGLDPELADRLGLESCERPGGGEEIAFPYLVGTEVVNHKYRSYDKTFRQDGGATKCFWNFNVICDVTLQAQPLIVTEGEFDAVVAIQCGYGRTVSVPDGAPKQALGDDGDRKYGYLEHAKSALHGVKEIILATDADEPGAALLTDLSIRLGKARCKWVRYPKGCKDLNDTLLRYGERGVHEVFRRAEWCRVDGVYRMSQLPPYPDRAGITTGFPFLDEHYRIRMGDFCVVTGVPGAGKSTWINDLICRVAMKHGWTVAVASFEQHPQADHRRALREWFMRRPEAEASAAEVADADKWIDHHFRFIVPADDDLANLAWTLERCAAAVVRDCARVIVIDPWNELDHDRPADMSLTEYTGKAIKEFKRLARSLECHVIVVAHPTKLAGGEMPGLYSISDSAHWANKPDVGIVLWKKQPKDTVAEIHVVKSRYWDRIGRPGSVRVVYEAHERRFYDAPEDESEGRAA